MIKKCSKLNKRLSIILTVCMLFQITQVSPFTIQKVSAATGFRHQTVGNDVMLGGNYIEVGVSKSGSFGTASPAPSGFHPTDGGVGLRVDGDGFDTGKAPTTGDFFLPGTPEESFTVGYKVGSSGAAPTRYTNAERNAATDVTTVTTDTTSSDTLSALTSGTTNDKNLAIQQKISFKVNDKFFKNTVTYTNKGTSTLYDVRYMRSFDPDQDASLHGSYETYNSVLENFPQDKRAIVRATGAVTRESVFFISLDDRARASTFGFANRDPYDTLAYNTDGSKLKASESLVDQAIAITFALGNLAPGQSTTFEYYTCLDPNYNSGLAAIMGSLGLQINNGSTTTNSLNVTLNLSGQNVTQMCFSNDNSTWSPWEPYAVTKAWTLTPGDGTKTVYVQFKDSANNVSSASASITYKDITAPTVSVSGNPTSWTNSDVTLTINASDDGSGLNSAGAYSFDGGLTWTTSNSKSFSSNGTVNIKVRDKSGNISSQDVVINKIDKAAPTFTGITSTPSTWTNNGVTLSVNGATDNGGAGLSSSAYSFSITQGVYNWQASNVSPSYSENQPVYVYVRDALGNVSTASTVNISAVDKVLPVITSVTGAPSDWTHDNVTLTVNASDDLSGVAVYSFDGGKNWQAEKTKTYSENTSNIEVQVKDAAGNIAAYSPINITKIDKTVPKITSVTPNTSDWTSGDVTLTIDASDDLSGLASEAYSFDGGKNWQAEKTKTYSENTSNIEVLVKDAAGNIAAYSPINITKIDKTVPKITSVTPNTSDWTSGDVILTVNASDDLSGLAAEAYSFDGGKNWQTEKTKAFKDNTSNIVVQVKDVVGNVAIYSPINITNIDKTEPSTAVIADSAKYIDSNWYKDTQTITASFTATAGCEEKLQHKVKDGAWTDGASVTVSTEGKYDVSFRVIDALNRTSAVQTVKVNVDKTAPTDLTISLKGNSFKKFLNKITFGMFSKDSVDVNITTDSNISGTNYIEYQLVDTSKGDKYDEVNGKWLKYTSLSISPQFKGVIYARAMDNAGNLTAVVSSDGLAVDNVQPTAPVITATVDGNPYAGEWTSKDVVISVAGASALAGIDHYEYKFGTNGTWNAMPNQTGAVDATSGKTINDKLTITETVGGTYYFRAVSSSGVIGAEITKVIKHDSTVPTTKVTSSGKIDAWTKDSVKFNVSNTNDDILCPVTSWIKIGNGDWTKINGDSYTFDAEINEPVRFKTVTAAGLENIDPKTYNVMLDKTAPVISGAEEGKAYYIGRVITIDDNSKAAYNSVYKLNNGSNTNFNSGDLISGVGAYDITVTDQAGNVSTLGFTVKALPTVSEVLYTSEWDNLIKDIRSEFDTHKDLPEPYKTNTDNAIKALENRFKSLDTEVKTIKQEVVVIKSDVSKLPAVNDGLIAMLDTIQNEYDKIAGNSSTLTTEEKAVLISEKNDLKQLLDTIKALKDKNADIITRASDIPTADDGLIAQRDAIKAILDEIAGLTNEQKTILKPTIDALNALLEKAKALQDKVDEEKKKADAIPTADDGLIAQKDNIQKVLDEMSKLTLEQKGLLKEKIDALNALLEKAKALQDKVDEEKKKADAIPTADDGLIAQKDNIVKVLDEISKLTPEQKDLLKEKIDALNALLEKAKALQDKVDEEKKKADAIPTADDGLIAQKGNIENVLDEISKLTPEQKGLLKEKTDALNALLEKAKALQTQVDAVKAKTEVALKGDGGLVLQREKIKALLDEISKLTPEQKNLLKQQIDSLTATLQSDMEKLKGLDEAVEKLQIVYAAGDNEDSVTKAMFLTKVGINGTSVTWNSSDTNIITDTGRVTRPEPEEQNKTITLIASIKDSKTNEVIKKQFKLTVKKLTYLEAACKQLTPERAFTFDSTGDTWESVTNKFLLLGKGAYDSTIAWTSNKPSIINISSSGNGVVGTVTRPENQDEDVILTATITRDGATATKTFLMTVKQKNVTKQSTSVRVDTNTAATLETGSSAAPVSVKIKRTTLDNNEGIIDTLIVTENAITALTDNINPLAQAAERIVTINMPQPTDGTATADEQAVEIPASAVQAMAERNAILEVKIGDARIELNTDELKELNNKGTDLYFKVVPIKDTSERSKLGDNTKANGAVIEIAKSLGNGVAVPQGVPYTVETNYSGLNTKLVVPFTGMTIPTENRAAFLASLRVYIEHTDGTKEAKGGTIVYKDGIPVGIEITIDRFSSFQVFSVEQPKANTTLPKTGSVVDFTTILILGALIMLTGFGLLRYRRKKTNTN